MKDVSLNPFIAPACQIESGHWAHLTIKPLHSALPSPIHQPAVAKVCVCVVVVGGEPLNAKITKTSNCEGT